MDRKYPEQFTKVKKQLEFMYLLSIFLDVELCILEKIQYPS